MSSGYVSYSEEIPGKNFTSDWKAAGCLWAWSDGQTLTAVTTSADDATVHSNIILQFQISDILTGYIL